MLYMDLYNNSFLLPNRSS